MLVIAAVLTATVSIAVPFTLRLQPWYGVNEVVFALHVIIALLLYAPSTGHLKAIYEPRLCEKLRHRWFSANKHDIVFCHAFRVSEGEHHRFKPGFGNVVHPFRLTE